MITTLTGPNAFVLRQARRKLVDSFTAEHSDMGLERLDGDASIDRIQEALTSLPFLASKKLVVLDTPSANKQFTERAEELIKNLPDSTDLLIIEPKLDKRGSYYKLLKKATTFQECSELDERGLASWLSQQAKSQGGTLSQGDALYLVDRVGVSQQLLTHELDKLLLYDVAVSKKTIELLTEAAPHSTIFELVEAAFNGHPEQALRLYAEQRALKVEPPQIVAMLTWQLYILALIKTAGQRSLDDVAREAKLSPYVVRKSSNIARNLTLGKLKALIADLTELDYQFKRKPIDSDEALKNYLLQIKQ